MESVAEIARFNPDPALLQWLSAQLAERDAELDRQRSELKTADLKIQALTLELAHHRRIRFGSKSEAFSPDQRTLFQETWETDLSAIEAEVEQQARPPRAKRERAGRQALPDHLPRIEHPHEPASCPCGHCGKDLIKIGEDISEQLDVEPARFFVHR